MPTLAIFASGRGSNAEAILRRFAEEPDQKVGLILSNSSKAGVLDLAREHKIPTYVSTRSEFYAPQSVCQTLAEHKIDWIALAGFLWLLPPVLLQAYPGRIVNIHPSLLPKFGGKGMYGARVHEAVHAAAERESGITIHFVDEHYDRGQVILQKRVPLTAEDNPESIAAKVLELEHRYYAETLLNLMRS